MKRLVLLAIVVIVASTTAFAQNEKNLSFSVGAELGFATGSFSNTHSIGTGATVQAELYVQENLKATATFGVLAYLGKSTTIANVKYKFPGQTIIPLRVGGKYFLAGGIYAGLQTGVGFLTGHSDNVAFAYSPLIGYEFKTNSDKSIDATFKYDGYSGADGSIGALGIRLAYVF